MINNKMLKEPLFLEFNSSGVLDRSQDALIVQTTNYTLLKEDDTNSTDTDTTNTNTNTKTNINNERENQIATLCGFCFETGEDQDNLFIYNLQHLLGCFYRPK